MREYFDSEGDPRLLVMHRRGRVGRYIIGTDDLGYIASTGDFPAGTSEVYVAEFSMKGPSDMDQMQAAEFLAVATSREQVVARGFTQQQRFTQDKTKARTLGAQGTAVGIAFMRMFQHPKPGSLFLEELAS